MLWLLQRVLQGSSPATQPHERSAAASPHQPHHFLASFQAHQTSKVRTSQVQTSQMQTLPMKTLLMQTLPMQTLPMQTLPMQTLPMQTSQKPLIPRKLVEDSL